MEATVGFSIADRKTLGIKNKSRQLSLLYKVQSMNLRDTLNALITRDFQNPLFIENNYILGSLDQLFEVTVEGVDLEVLVTRDQLGAALSSTINEGRDYVKIVLYRIYEEYINYRRINNLPINRAITFNQANYLDCSGLFIALENPSLFTGQQDNQQNAFIEPLIEEKEAMGREERTISPIAPSVPLTPERPVEHFQAFSKLPCALNIVQRQQLVIDAGVNLGNIPQIALIPPTQENGIGDDNVGIDSRFALFITPEQATYYSYQLRSVAPSTQTVQTIPADQQGQPTPPGAELSGLSSIIIRSRRTDYTVIERSQFNSFSQSTQANFVMSFFENERAYSRVYADVNYITEVLDTEILRHVRSCHSKQIVYNNIKLVSFERKLWFGKENTIAKKSPMKPIYSKEVPFQALVLGTNSNQTVNVNTNLLLTAQFSNSLTTFYRSNRYITCTAFSSVDQIAEPQNLKLWRTLENAFGRKVVLMDFPSVILEPCFLRGTVLECTDMVQVRGLVSNAGTQQDFP